MRSASSTWGRIATLTTGLLFLALPAAYPQDAGQKGATDQTVPAPQAMGKTKKAEKQILLNDVAPESTEEAARRAAKETASLSSKKKDDKASDTGIDSVLEFHPASAQEKAEAKSSARPSVKHTKKNIHGEAYGGLDPASSGTHQGGGAAGATSKSGKTSVYIQGEQTRATQPPH
jgi:hypothetical protein